jgi:hypothetical protein
MQLRVMGGTQCVNAAQHDGTTTICSAAEPAIAPGAKLPMQSVSAVRSDVHTVLNVYINIPQMVTKNVFETEHLSRYKVRSLLHGASLCTNALARKPAAPPPQQL